MRAGSKPQPTWGTWRMNLRRRSALVGLTTLMILIGAGPPATIVAAQPAPAQAQFTWMSIANWLFEVGNTRVVINGYISRIKESDFAGEGPTGLDRAKAPMKPE